MMKTIRQVHDEEQREARIAEVHQQFQETMNALEREHAASQKRIRTTVNVMCAVAAVALLVPVILLVIRMILHR